jgi:hypothetical protein
MLLWLKQWLVTSECQLLLECDFETKGGGPTTPDFSRTLHVCLFMQWIIVRSTYRVRAARLLVNSASWGHKTSGKDWLSTVYNCFPGYNCFLSGVELVSRGVREKFYNSCWRGQLFSFSEFCSEFFLLHKRYYERAAFGSSESIGNMKGLRLAAVKASVLWKGCAWQQWQHRCYERAAVGSNESIGIMKGLRLAAMKASVLWKGCAWQQWKHRYYEMAAPGSNWNEVSNPFFGLVELPWVWLESASSF